MALPVCSDKIFLSLQGSDGCALSLGLIVEDKPYLCILKFYVVGLQLHVLVHAVYIITTLHFQHTYSQPFSSPSYDYTL